MNQRKTSPPGPALTGRADKKRRGRKQPKKPANMKQDCSSRATTMASIGPISAQSVNFFRSRDVNFKQAKILAVKEFLTCYLNYEEDELSELEIMETRMSTHEDIINVALAEEDQIRELYIRKAELRREDITIRSYIPPNFYERYMALNKICTEKRAAEGDLKTQLRFGRKNIEVFIKYKDEDKGFRQVPLDDFTDMTKIPPFNYEVKWRRYRDKPTRRVTSRGEEPSVRPSTQGQVKSSGKPPSMMPPLPPSLTSDTPDTGKKSVTQPLKRANSNSNPSSSKK